MADRISFTLHATDGAARTGVLATAGTTYRIALDGFHGAGGTATLTWD